MVVRLVIAGIFSLIGIGGLILPILPGWLFLILALVVLFPTARFSTSLFDRLERRMPRFGRILRRIIVGKRRPAWDPVARRDSR